MRIQIGHDSANNNDTSIHELEQIHVVSGAYISNITRYIKVYHYSTDYTVNQTILKYCLKLKMMRQIASLFNNKCIKIVVKIAAVFITLLFIEELFRVTKLLTKGSAIAVPWSSHPVDLHSPAVTGSSQNPLPDCIIIGVRKSGTRALLHFLNLHPDIVTVTQETHFFDDNASYAHGLDYYRSMMPNVSDVTPRQVVIEKTPRYFMKPYVPARIHEMNSSIKLLVVVREPVVRLVSEYVHFYVRKGRNRTFEVSCCQ